MVTLNKTANVRRAKSARLSQYVIAVENLNKVLLIPDS